MDGLAVSLVDDVEIILGQSIVLKKLKFVSRLSFRITDPVDSDYTVK